MNEKLKPSDPITFQDQTRTLNEWAEQLGCRVQTLIGRHNRKWSIERMLTEPVGKVGGGNRGKKLAAEPLTPDELKALLAQCNDGSTGIRNRALIVLGWRAGLRISEAIDLKPEDLTEAQQSIRVLHGKGDKARTVGIDNQAWAIMQTWITRRAELQLPAGSRLFCTLAGGQLSDRYVRQLMTRLGDQAKIGKRVHYHGLRHTMAFELAQEGIAMHVIQQQLGHSSLAITSRYVSHLNPAETIQRMRSRKWEGSGVAPSATSSTPAPGWLEDLRRGIGDRLFLFHDGRTSETEFKAAVLLF
jgi:integrase